MNKSKSTHKAEKIVHLKPIAISGIKFLTKKNNNKFFVNCHYKLIIVLYSTKTVGLTEN